jgi:RNA polymerase sigma-70 factor (ECF subfamily)
VTNTTITPSLRPRNRLATTEALHEDAHVSDGRPSEDLPRGLAVAPARVAGMTVPGDSDLRTYVAIARAAWPTIELADDELTAYVVARATEALPPVEHAGDLLLACACTLGRPTAISAFHLTYGSVIRRVLTRRNAGAADLADATQIVYERLLVGQAGRAPLLSEYGGKGPLRVWISTSAARTLLTMRRSEGRRRANEGASSHAIGTIASAINPELMYFKRLYKHEIETAVAHALDSLDVHTRALLQLHLGERLSIDQLGAMYGVNRATAARWLAAGRETLIGRVRTEIRNHLKLSESEYDSIVALVRSELDVTVGKHLAESIAPDVGTA